MPKVMLLEDDQSMLSLLTILLQLEGYTICAPSGDDSESMLAFIRQEQPDLILLDVNLRQINGIEMLRQLRCLPDLCTTRVIMTSGLNLYAECMQAGADDFLLKPYMPDELIKIIKHTIG